MTPVFGRSIKGVFFYSFIVLIIIPMLAIGLLSLNTIERNLKAEIITTNLLLTKSLAAEIDEILSRADKLIFVTGGMVQEELAAGRNLDAVLNTIVKAFPAFSHIQILDDSGRVQHSSRTQDSWVGYDLSRHPVFMDALNQSGPQWSNSHVPIKGKAPSVAISRRFDNHVVIGYLDLIELSRTVRSLAMETGVRAAILDRRATIAASSEPGIAEQRANLSFLPYVRQGLDGEFSSGFRDDENGAQAIVSVVKIKNGDLMAVVFRDAKIALAPVAYVQKVLLTSVALACLAAILVIFHTYRRIMRPLNALSQYTDHVAQGRYDLSAEKRGIEEFEHLEHNFLLMAEAVSAREKSLKKALAEVKQLSGLLPICSSCKKIRDDKGYWNQIESYIRMHSDAQFSHSICPDCARVLYPDLEIYPNEPDSK